MKILGVSEESYREIMGSAGHPVVEYVIAYCRVDGYNNYSDFSSEVFKDIDSARAACEKFRELNPHDEYKVMMLKFYMISAHTDGI